MAHPDIALLNAVYPSVPAVVLPVDGGGTAQFDDTTDATATASQIAKNATAYVNNALVTGTYTPFIVKGSFTTGNANTNGTFDIPYAGTGYPIVLLIYVKGGAYNNTSTGNATWYNSTQRYAIGIHLMLKSNTTTTPTYTGSGAANSTSVAIVYKNSTSVATTYSRSSTMSTANYATASTDGSSTSATQSVKFKGSGTKVSYYVGYYTNADTYAYGLHPGIEYEYLAVYSS